MIVASRYAKSLLDLSVEKGQLEAVYADMLQVKEVCENSRDFITFLNINLFDFYPKWNLNFQILRKELE